MREYLKFSDVVGKVLMSTVKDKSGRIPEG